jgi:hypothetical protein
MTLRAWWASGSAASAVRHAAPLVILGSCAAAKFSAAFKPLRSRLTLAGFAPLAINPSRRCLSSRAVSKATGLASMIEGSSVRALRALAGAPPRAIRSVS